jgi:hypothetical protein
MDRNRKSNLVGGLLLVLLGLWFLAAQLIPGLNFWINATISWPLIVIGVGVLLLLLGSLLQVPGLAVPAAIVGGIGCLLYWQNASGNWESWAYAWTLIPGFVGIGIILSGLLGSSPRQSYSAGVNLIIISLVGFVIFASFLGGWNILGPYWPVLIILLGVWILVRPRVRAS